MFMLLPSVVLVSWSGGAGVHVQPDCGNRSSDDAQSLRHSRLGGQLGSHFLFRIYEVSVDLTPTPVCVQHVENMQWILKGRLIIVLADYPGRNSAFFRFIVLMNFLLDCR